MPELSIVDRIVQREEYPVFQRSAYLDTSSCGPIARSTVEAARAEQELLMTQGSSRYLYWRDRGMAEARRIVSESIGASEKGIALVTSFSVGMALMAPLLAHRRKVLLVEGDYPSLHAPFIHRGSEVVMLKPDPDGVIGMDALETMMAKERPGVLAMSHVQWTTGFRVDLGAIAALCRAYNTCSVIDATQSWCSVPLDVHALGIDIIGASGYKWPLAGFGNGLFHISGPIRDEIMDATGIDAVENLTEGHRDPVAVVRLMHALGRIEGIGQQAIMEHVSQLCEHAIERFDTIGIPLLNGREANDRAGILMIEGDEQRLALLELHHVQVALRGKGIRIGIHFYNTMDDIDRLAEALSA